MLTFIGDYASLMLSIKDYDNALELLNKAIQIDKKEAIFYLNRANIYLRLDNNEKAIQDLNTSNRN